MGTTLTLESITTIAALLMVQQPANRVGTLRLYVWVKVGNLAVSLGAFATMASQRNAIPVLLIAATISGVLQGFSITLGHLNSDAVPG